MPLPPDVRKRLEDQAVLARAEFEARWKDWKATDVAHWWDKWCRNGGTNHDRLGRILMDVTGVRKSRSTVVGKLTDFLGE